MEKDHFHPHLHYKLVLARDYVLSGALHWGVLLTLITLWLLPFVVLVIFSD